MFILSRAAILSFLFFLPVISYGNLCEIHLNGKSSTATSFFATVEGKVRTDVELRVRFGKP